MNAQLQLDCMGSPRRFSEGAAVSKGVGGGAQPWRCLQCKALYIRKMTLDYKESFSAPKIIRMAVS